MKVAKPSPGVLCADAGPPASSQSGLTEQLPSAHGCYHPAVSEQEDGSPCVSDESEGESEEDSVGGRGRL